MKHVLQHSGFATILIMIVGFILVLVLVGVLAGENTLPTNPQDSTETTEEPDLREHSSGALVEEGCQIGGCSSELCTTADSSPPVSTCQYEPVYQCFKEPFARCVSTGTAQCEWEQNEQLQACVAHFNE